MRIQHEFQFYWYIGSIRKANINISEIFSIVLKVEMFIHLKNQCYMMINKFVHDFIKLLKYENLFIKRIIDFWEKKFLRSAMVTKSNNQSMFFKTILLINHRKYEENFFAVWERCLREKLFSKSKIIQISLFSLLFFLSAAFLADSASWWI